MSTVSMAWEDAFLAALRQSGGNVSRAAELAGVSQRNVYMRRSRSRDFRARWAAMDAQVRADRVRRVTAEPIERLTMLQSNDWTKANLSTVLMLSPEIDRTPILAGARPLLTLTAVLLQLVLIREQPELFLPPFPNCS